MLAFLDGYPVYHIKYGMNVQQSAVLAAALQMICTGA